MIAEGSLIWLRQIALAFDMLSKVVRAIACGKHIDFELLCFAWSGA